MNIKKRSMSDVSHKGGFPRAIDDVVRTNSPLIVTIRNKSAVMISPCPPTMERAVSDSMSFGRVLATLSFADLDEQVHEFAMAHFVIGLYAQAMLLETLDDDKAEELFEAGKKLVASIHKAGLKAGRKMLKDFETFIQNSSEEGGSVSPMTTARADVSEVMKQAGNEELFPASSRKAKGKKTSSPQKRKIGTKREKSA